MNNYKLLEKYRKKLSVHFALFVLFSFWFIQAIFLVVEYIPENLDVQETLEKRLVGVKNIIENHEVYLEKINNNDTTLEKILIKTLENVVVLEGCKDGLCNKKMISNIDDLSGIIFKSKDKFIDEGEYKYLKESIIFNNVEYQVIIRMLNEYSYSKLLNYYLYFLIFSFPFSVLFYFIGYYFVGKNFKPIRETIAGLEDFTSNINHEMKTPLTEIVSTLSLAKKLKNYDEAIDQSLESSKKLNKILDSMLGIVNLVDMSYNKQKFNLIKELKSIIKEHSKEISKKEIIIKTHFKNSSYFLKSSREHLDICVGNIITNAIKYSDKGGTIDISFNNGELVIRDYGIGINKKNIKNIFDRYFRENYIKEEGHGIGLSLVKKIIDINGWKIKIESQKRNSVNGVKGTKVIISFV